MSDASWTIAALLAYQTGVPYKLPMASVSDYQEFLPGLKGMGEILGENGYRNYFMKFNAMDLFPTILASIGASIPGERLGLGTNLFSGERTLQEGMWITVQREELAWV